MKFGILLTTILIIAVSCKSSKALAFKESLDQFERKAFEIVLGKEGPAEKKLKCLVKEDYKGAIAAVEQQREEFDKLIADIKKISTNNIPEGESIKTAALEYYQSLEELHVFDKKEIEQQALLRTPKENQLEDASNKLIALARQKKMLYNKVHRKEALLHTAAKSFEAANGF